MFRSCAAVFLTTFLMAVFLLPIPVTAQDDGILPDGCLGNLNGNQVVVYYFHRKFRCQSCEVLESTLHKTLKVKYADQFGAGRLAMCVVNVDSPENRHYLDQFMIFSNSVVIVETKNGSVSRYKKLESIWEVSEDSDAISHLLQTEVGGFLPES